MRVLLSILILLSAAAPALAGEDAFTPGPVFKEFGPVADVDATFPIPDGAVFKVQFDTRVQAEKGELNKTLVSAARLINMLARADVPVENVHVAVVIHGGAVRDATNAARYAEAVGGDNANAALIAALKEKGARIILCGQSAAYYDVETKDLLPGVEMALSAMVAHALLEQEGYSLNPF